MTLIELKKRITDNISVEDFIIFVTPKAGDTFLADAYIEELCRVKNCNTIPVESIYEPLTSALSLVIDFENNYSLLRTEEFNEAAEDYSSFINTIVVCDKIDKDIAKAAEDFIIKLPTLQDWHITDFIKQQCPALDDYEAKWLCEATNQNIYRTIQELDKINIFPAEQQREIFNEIRFDPASDLYAFKIFDISTALAHGNLVPLREYLLHGKFLDFDPIAIVNLTLTEVKNALLIIHSKVAPAAIGKSDSQGRGITYGCRDITLEKAKRMIEFLSNIDLRLKSSELDMSRERLIDYIISHLLAC